MHVLQFCLVNAHQQASGQFQRGRSARCLNKFHFYRNAYGAQTLFRLCYSLVNPCLPVDGCESFHFVTTEYGCRSTAWPLVQNLICIGELSLMMCAISYEFDDHIRVSDQNQYKNCGFDLGVFLSYSQIYFTHLASTESLLLKHPGEYTLRKLCCRLDNHTLSRREDFTAALQNACEFISSPLVQNQVYIYICVLANAITQCAFLTSVNLIAVHSQINLFKFGLWLADKVQIKQNWQS